MSSEATKDTEETWVHATKGKKLNWKGYLLYYESNYKKMLQEREKTMETVKYQQEMEWWDRCWGGVQEFLGQWKYSVWQCKDENMSVYIYSNPWVAQ